MSITSACQMIILVLTGCFGVRTVWYSVVFPHQEEAVRSLAATFFSLMAWAVLQNFKIQGGLP